MKLTGKKVPEGEGTCAKEFFERSGGGADYRNVQRGFRAKEWGLS